MNINRGIVICNSLIGIYSAASASCSRRNNFLDIVIMASRSGKLKTSESYASVSPILCSVYDNIIGLSRSSLCIIQCKCKFLILQATSRQLL